MDSDLNDVPGHIVGEEIEINGVKFSESVCVSEVIKEPFSVKYCASFGKNQPNLLTS